MTSNEENSVTLESQHSRSVQVRSHVTQKLGQISKTRPAEMYILCSSLRISARASLIDLYLYTEFHGDRKKKKFQKSTLTLRQSSKSRDTKTRANIKYPARSNLDIVP